MAWYLTFRKYSKILVPTVPQNITFREVEGLDRAAQISGYSSQLLPLLTVPLPQCAEDFKILVEPEVGRSLDGRNLPTDCFGLFYE